MCKDIHFSKQEIDFVFQSNKNVCDYDHSNVHKLNMKVINDREIENVPDKCLSACPQVLHYVSKM